jgi:non-ribosomal peptide synthetase component F
LESEAVQKQKAYWLNLFTGSIPAMNLPGDEDSRSNSFAGARCIFPLGKDLSRQITGFALTTKSTKYMVVLAAFNIMLSKYIDQEDIVVGTPVFGRNHPDLLNIIGMFVNMLVMRNYPREDKTFAAFLKEVKENALNAYENQDYQFEQLVWDLDKISAGKNHLEVNIAFELNTIDDMFTDNHSRQKVKLAPAEADAKPTALEADDFALKPSKFDLSLAAVEEKNELMLMCEYRSKLFKQKTIKQMLQHLKRILEQVTKDPKIKIAEITMLSKEEQDKLINEIKGKSKGKRHRQYAQEAKPRPNREKTASINVNFDF